MSNTAGRTEARAKLALYEQFALVGKALSSPLRLLILDLLAQGEQRVDELAAALEAKVGNTSAQLQVLRAGGLVEGRREGTSVFYRLAGPEVAVLVDQLRAVASEQLAEAERAANAYLGDRRSMEPVGPDELARGAADGSTLVIDVRPEREYRAGHIASARSIPLEQLEARLAELPTDTEIVAYCRGAWCVYAPPGRPPPHRPRLRGALPRRHLVRLATSRPADQERTRSLMRQQSTPRRSRG